MIFNQTYVSPPYAPTIWNDTGHYDYFYIDFKKTLVPFSLGMFVESILVYGTAPITVTGIEKINGTTFKVYANISGLIHGLVVMSKSPTRLKLVTGKELPAFSTFTFVSGIVTYIDGGYIYEHIAYDFKIRMLTETTDTAFWTAIDVGNTQDSVNYAFSVSSTSETPSIILT